MTTVYRFHETAAIATRGGPTRYLNAKDARTIARALLTVARSIERERFSDSTCGTVTAPDFASAHEAEKARPRIDCVIKDATGRTVRTSRNLRGLLDHARRVGPPVRVALRHAVEVDRGRDYVMSVDFPDGSQGSSPWADWRVAGDWFKSRRSWAGADLCGLDSFVVRARS